MGIKAIYLVQLKLKIMKKRTKKSNKLFAIWKYDLPPYYLGGKVIELLPGGYVTVEEYGDAEFRYYKLFPIQEGIDIIEKIEKAHQEYKETVSNAKNKLTSEINKLISNDSSNNK